MEKNFCKKIDQDSLIEQYVAGKLRGNILREVEQHIKECEDHAQAVLLEKALKRGVSDFARGEIKTRLRDRLKKREDTRFMILRYAAILLVAVITPLILYYQFNVAPEEMATSLPQKEQRSAVEESKEVLLEDKKQSALEEKSKESVRTSTTSEKKPPSPLVPASSKPSAPEGIIVTPQEEEPAESRHRFEDESAQLQDLLKSSKSTPTPKLEADYPPTAETSQEKAGQGARAYRTTALKETSPKTDLDITSKITEDSLAIRECIGSYLNEYERENFRIVLNFKVFKNGTTGEIRIINSTHPSSELESCLLNIVKQWTYPKDVIDRQVIQEIKY